MVEAARKGGPVALEPVELLKQGDTEFLLLSGIREWLAAQRAEIHELQAVIYENLAEDLVTAKVVRDSTSEPDPISLAEQLNAVREAGKAIGPNKRKRLTAEELGQRFGLSRSNVAHYLRLLKLADPAKAYAKKGHLKLGHLRPLISLPPHIQALVAKRAHDSAWDVRMVEAFAQRVKTGELEGRSRKDPNVARLEQQLSETLGAKCSLEEGRLVIDYGGANEVMEGILNRLGLGNS